MDDIKDNDDVRFIYNGKYGKHKDDFSAYDLGDMLY